MKLLITESKSQNLIRAYTLKMFPDVKDVKFTTKRKVLGSTEGSPVKEETVIMIIIDNTKDGFKKKYNDWEIKAVKNKIFQDLNETFSLEVDKYGSDWGFEFYQETITRI